MNEPEQQNSGSGHEVTAQSGVGPSSTVGSVARLLMGLVLVVAGLTKVWDPVPFYWEVLSYLEVVHIAREWWPNIGRASIVLGGAEVGLGISLLVNWRPRFCLPASVLLMALFLGLTGLAWYRGTDMDCGCFGALVERSPGQAAAEDVVMLILLLTAWKWGTHRLPAFASLRARQFLFLGTLTALIVTAVRFYPESGRLETSDLQPGLSLEGMRLRGSELDLSKGDYLVELFSPRCVRCMRTVPTLNRWLETPGLPPVVGITVYPVGSEDMEHFRQKVRPRYPIATVSTADWRRLTWRHGYPRLAHLRNGVVRQVWEWNATPSTRQLQHALGKG